MPEGRPLHRLARQQAVPEAASRRVYKQATCYDCGTPVVTTTVNGRTAYACPHCQPA